MPMLISRCKPLLWNRGLGAHVRGFAAEFVPKCWEFPTLGKGCQESVVPESVVPEWAVPNWTLPVCKGLQPTNSFSKCRAHKVITRIPPPARPVLGFVQLCLLVFGQALPDDFQLLKSIFENGLFRVFLSDTDRRQQDGLRGERAVRHFSHALYVFVAGEFHRGFSRGPRLVSDRFIDGHQLRAIEESLDGGKIGILSRDQNSARPALVFERLDCAASNRIIRGNNRR